MAEKLHKEDTEWSRLSRLSLLRLSSTDWKDDSYKEFQELAKLKTHFGLLTLEDDVVDYLEPKYWHSDPNWVDYMALAIIIGVFGWFVLTVIGVL